MLKAVTLLVTVVVHTEALEVEVVIGMVSLYVERMVETFWTTLEVVTDTHIS